MAKKTFVTVELRESVGQCVKVSDAVMMQSHVERMGTCGACGHAIKNECGIRTPDGALMWVGSCCAKILCRKDAEKETVEPGSRWNDGTRDLVSMTQEEYDKLFSVAFKGGQHHIGSGCYEYHPRLYVLNMFVANILDAVDRYSPKERIVTKKQYDALMKCL